MLQLPKVSMFLEDDRSAISLKLLLNGHLTSNRRLYFIIAANYGALNRLLYCIVLFAGVESGSKLFGKFCAFNSDKLFCKVI
jgi:hypothetical protein